MTDNGNKPVDDAPSAARRPENPGSGSTPGTSNGSTAASQNTVTARRQLERRLLTVPDNWDGHNAKAPRLEAVKTMLAILESLPAEVPFPDGSPGTNGDVILEWESPGAEVLLIIESANSVETTVAFDGSRFEGPFESLTSEVAAAFRKIVSNV